MSLSATSTKTTRDNHWRSRRLQLVGRRDDIDAEPPFKLPMLPAAVQKFTSRAEDPEASNQELAGILETDSGLTVDVLNLVNSGAFGLRSKVSTVKHAFNLMGLERVRTFVLMTAVKRAMASSHSKMINLQKFWAANLEKAIFAQEVAKLMNADGETAFSAAMLQDFLLPALTSSMFDKYSLFLDQKIQGQEALHLFEQRMFAWDHAIASARVACQWHFPDELVCCLGMQHRGLSILMDPDYIKTSVAAVALSALLPDPLQQVPDGLDQLERLEKVWPKFDLAEMAETTERRFLEMGGNQVHHFTCKRRLEKRRASADQES